MHIHALNGAAEEMGLSRGMALSDARAIVPGLTFRPAAPAADLQRLRGLARWCGRYTPWVNVENTGIDGVDGVDGTDGSGGADGLILDISGCAHLFGGETALLREISARLEAFGLDHRLAVAQTRGAAWALARYGGGKITVSDAMTSAELIGDIGELPVAALRLGGEAVLTLRRLGLTRIRQVAAIPRVALQRRFGSRDLAGAVVRRLDQARGDSGEPVSPLMPVPRFRARKAFAEPVLEIAGIEQTLRGLLADLCAVLEKQGVGARRMSLAAYRTDGSVALTTIGTSAASRDASHLMLLLKEKLQYIEAEYGIDLVILSADDVAPFTGRQLSLTGDARQDVPVAQLVDRLSGRLGARQVRCRRPRESYIPERSDAQVPALSARRRRDFELSARASWRDSRLAMPFLPPPRPFRLFEPPEILDVMAEVPDGPPVSFRWRRMQVRVARAEGPERIAPEWWRSHEGRPGDIRDYYRLEDAMGRRFWVYRRGLYGEEPGMGPDSSILPAKPAETAPRWFIHGLFA